MILETVADVRHGQQVLRVPRIVFDSLSQLAHIGPKVVHLIFKFRASDDAQYLLVTDRLPSVAHQQVEYVELGGGQGNGNAPT